ncbi:hypothetical protein HGRIS_003224 [Hohenbuehelia grisea]|uniref:WD40 repeat-like protein n=1 Tax=Hohenbuehelia grisea TaxID=104357 RepID=A0ABR3JN22_9AGAR
MLADFTKFEQRFHDGYMLSAPQMYFSGLSLAPEASKLRELYGDKFSMPIAVIKGREGSWPTAETPVIGVKAVVECVVFSPDGKQIVSGSGDRTIRIWDAATREQVGDALTGHEDPVTSVAFSPDGKQIVSGSGDRTIRIWDSSTGQETESTLNMHHSTLRSGSCPPLSLVRHGDWIHLQSHSGPGHHILWIPPVFRHHKMQFHPCSAVISKKPTLHIQIQDGAIGNCWRDIYTLGNNPP